MTFLNSRAVVFGPMPNRRRTFFWLGAVVTCFVVLQTMLVVHHTFAVTGSGYFDVFHVFNTRRLVSANTTVTTTVTTKTVPLVLPTAAARANRSGTNLAAKIREMCAQVGGLPAMLPKLYKKGLVPRLIQATAKKAVYCPVEKIGTTFWRRVLFTINHPKNVPQYRNPYDVPIGLALANSPASRASNLMENNFNFYFVRDPYSRLLSAFVDKLVSPNPYFWTAWGKKAIALTRGVKTPVSGHDVTFAEFVNLVVTSEKTGRNRDSHYDSITSTCNPCEANYKYVGRMETFEQDAVGVMTELGLDTFATSTREDKGRRAVDDAIEDSTSGPFSWRKDIVKAISWEKALHRIWLKLQMRGIISIKHPLTFTDFHANNITRAQFIELAKRANREFPAEEKKGQKAIVKLEAFSALPEHYIEGFQTAFRKDFQLFGYSLKPSYIEGLQSFKPEHLLFFNYSHLN